MPSNKCTNCHKDELIIDRNQGEIVCTNCGVVNQEHIIDEQYEGRIFNNEEDHNAFKTRLGAPYDPLFGPNFDDLIIVSPYENFQELICLTPEQKKSEKFNFEKVIKELNKYGEDFNLKKAQIDQITPKLLLLFKKKELKESNLVETIFVLIKKIIKSKGIDKKAELALEEEIQNSFYMNQKRERSFSTTEKEIEQKLEQINSYDPEEVFKEFKSFFDDIYNIMLDIKNVVASVYLPPNIINNITKIGEIVINNEILSAIDYFESFCGIIFFAIYLTDSEYCTCRQIKNAAVKYLGEDCKITERKIKDVAQKIWQNRKILKKDFPDLIHELESKNGDGEKIWESCKKKGTKKKC